MPDSKTIEIKTKAEEDSSENETDAQEEAKEAQKVEPEKEEQEKKQDEPAEELEKAHKEAKDNYDRLLRVSAEFENYKKRNERQKDELRKYANEALLSQLLFIVDSLERAISLAGEHKDAGENFVQGIEMTLKELLKIFETFAVKPIDSAGKKFDPKFHQAMSQEVSDEHPENTVITELQKGYMLRDRLLRPAMVVVSKAEKQE